MTTFVTDVVDEDSVDQMLGTMPLLMHFNYRILDGVLSIAGHCMLFPKYHSTLPSAAHTVASFPGTMLGGCINCAGVGMAKTTVNKAGAHDIDTFDFVCKVTPPQLSFKGIVPRVLDCECVVITVSFVRTS